jgi:AcrR family transcriptional regulator
MHTLARRAETSIGSLYHFFPDRDGVLEALRQRHATATRKISQDLRKIPAATWRQYSADDAIACLITPFVKYLRHHPDFLPLTVGQTTTEEDADFIRVIRHVLDARLPKLKSVDRQGYASMLHAISVGTMHAGFQAGSRFVEMCLLEVPRVLTAYLSAIEASGKSRAR